jgi:hypothetical protein
LKPVRFEKLPVRFEKQHPSIIKFRIPIGNIFLN